MTKTVTVGDFIEIPAWKVTGCVMAVEPSPLGSDAAIVVRLQESPDEPEARWRRYRLEPDEYQVL